MASREIRLIDLIEKSDDEPEGIEVAFAVPDVDPEDWPWGEFAVTARAQLGGTEQGSVLMNAVSFGGMIPPQEVVIQFGSELREGARGRVWFEDGSVASSDS